MSEKMENTLSNKAFVSRFTNAEQLTNGQKSEGLLTLKPLEKGPPEHIHTQQLEFFEVVSGALTVKVNGIDFLLKNGERIEIKKGDKHTYFNATNEAVVSKFGYEPALNIQFLLDSFDSGDSKNGGNWSKFPLLETGFLLYHFRHQYRLANLPFWLQDFVFGTLSKIAKWTKMSDKITLPQNLL
jgi:mannose-6-phosphate isomerase-like protein (cupin superfamily)